MLDFIANLQPGYAYPALFFGHIFFGGLVLIPALYLSVTKALSLPVLFLIIILSSMFNDSFWYFIGGSIKKEKIYSFRFIKKRMAEARKFSAFYDRHGVWTVFFTKFIYGTRIASHILAGVHRISFAKFLAATAAGTAVWFMVMYFLIKGFDKGVSGTGSVAFRIQIVFLAAFAVIFLVNWFTGTYIRKRLMKTGKRK
jgi:membrane protein DedA with SNARE-associated domain